MAYVLKRSGEEISRARHLPVCYVVVPHWLARGKDRVARGKDPDYDLT